LGVAAVVVIHQPSIQVFSQFDRLILLSKGKCVFSDETTNIPSFYEDIGREMPKEYLVPNDILNAASNWIKNGYDNVSTTTQSDDQLVPTCGEKLLRQMKERKKPSTFLQVKTVLVRYDKRFTTSFLHYYNTI
jgi:ABC-type multidrug transport system ATPase subunit